MNLTGITGVTYDGQQPRGEAGHQILACARTDDGVVGSRYGRAVIGRYHQTHLDELRSVHW